MSSEPTSVSIGFSPCCSAQGEDASCETGSGGERSATSPASPSRGAARSKTRLILVRHGETAWNADGRIQGQLDVALSEIGRGQARQVSQELQKLGVLDLADAIVSSDLSRARETADIIAELSPRSPQRRVDSGLRELKFGTCEGKLFNEKEVQELRHTVFSVWKDGSNLNATFDGGESAVAVMERGLEALRQAARLGDCVLVVAHGQLLKWCAIAIALADGETMSSPRVQEIWQSKIGNCCLSHIVFEHDTGRFIPHSWFQQAIVKEALDDTG